ncbi:MAG TPA: hypothetical protein VH186_01915 [Chloroflexia bacterium]|nr:hypothetical protein [Chloroflexia bacterium]
MAVLNSDLEESGDEDHIEQENKGPGNQGPEEPAFAETLEG